LDHNAIHDYGDRKESVTIIVLRNSGMDIYDRLEIELAEMVFVEK